MARRSLVAVLGLLVAMGAARCSRPPQGDGTSQTAEGAIRPGGEIIASVRTEPANYNRYFEARAAVELINLLTQARLVTVNRKTDALEPALAESWDTAEGLTYRVKLRQGIKFSDGAPFTAEDVLFSFKAAQDAPESIVRSYIQVGGKPLTARALDPHTVAITFPEPFAPALRILDNLPILPRHKLQKAFDDKTMKTAWTPGKPASEVTGLGPFRLVEHVAGQRLVFARNPHYWRRDAQRVTLPYLDRLTVIIVPDQNAEALRLETGAIDLMTNADIQPTDYARFRRLSNEGRVQLLDGGVALDPNVLWFNLTRSSATRKPWLHDRTFRQALSYAADRQAIADTVYLGEAVPIYGPITPRNTTWFSPAAPTYPFDRVRASQLLGSIGLRDTNGDGVLEDRRGQRVRFSMLVQQGHAIRERTASMLQAHFRAVGVGVDIVTMEQLAIQERWSKADYDAIFHGFQVTVTDPAMTMDLWLSSSPQHIWNPSQPVPATPWERRIDELMMKQAATPALEERQRLFAEVQRIIGEELPAMYFAAPKVTIAASRRVMNLQPVAQIPQLLWAADSIAVADRSDKPE